MASQLVARGHWIDQLDPALASSVRFYSNPANLHVPGTGRVSRWVLAGLSSPEQLERLVQQQQLKPSSEHLRADDFRVSGLELLAISPGTASQFSSLQKLARAQGLEVWQEVSAIISLDAPIDLGTISEPVFTAATASDYDGDGNADTTWHLQASAAPTAIATGN